MQDIWAIKYRPNKLEEYIFNNSQQKLKFQEYLSTKQIPHLLLSGTQGTGKTTIAKMLIDNLVDKNDVLIVDGSKQNSVEFMRDTILDFISTYPFGEYKIVLIEECDYLSHNAQAVLRTPLEDEHNTARFIMTCNYDHKLMPAIKSRFTHFRFKSPSVESIIVMMADILFKEQVKFELPLLEKYVSLTYPDIRQTLTTIQQNISNKILTDATNNVSSTSDYKLELLPLIQANKWEDARKLVCANVSQGEWEDVYRFLYDNIHQCSKFSKRESYDSAIEVIAEQLYKHGLIADPEICAAATFIKLGKL